MASDAAAKVPRRLGRARAVAFGVVAILAAVLVLGGIWYYAPVQSLPHPENTPPRILGIVATPSAGDNRTVFTFTAQVVDVQNPVRTIEVRWDWENDSIWDTGWSTNKSAMHLFSNPANYTVRSEAKDTGGLTTNATRVIRVTRVPPKPLRIGTLFSITGGLSLFGTGQQNAVDMAIEEINAAGGVLGQPIQVFHADDTTDSTTASSQATSLITQDRVDAIVGATGAPMCASILPIAKSNNVPEVSPSCASALFSNVSYTGGWFARTVASEELQAVVAAEYAHVNLSYAYSAVIGINNAYGVRTATAYADNFTRFGGTITVGSPRLVNEIGGTTTDYTTDLHAILDVAPAPQIVYAIAYPYDGVVLMKNWWAGRGTNPGWTNIKWMFSEGLDDQIGFINPLVGSGVNVAGFNGTAPAAYAGIFPRTYAPWAARYQSRYGVAPSLFAANAYDAAYLVALAAEASGNVSGPSIRAHLQTVAAPPGDVVGPDQWSLALQVFGASHDVNYEGASGSVNLNAIGNVPSGYIIWGVDGSNRLYTQAFFNETSVVSLLPTGFFPRVAGTESRFLLAVSSRREPR